MVQVFITVDVEIWADGWNAIEQKFPKAFEQYIYGHTSKGQFGLPFKLQILNDYGIKADFFIESLFASIFGTNPLQEIVGLVKTANQGLQLHLHPEWALKVPNSSIYVGEKKAEDLSVEDYRVLFEAALDNLRCVGVPAVRAFRAGSYHITPNIMEVLAQIPITIDTSYNPCYLDRCSSISPDLLLLQPQKIHGLDEYPVSVFKDFLGKLRPMQITACSSGEMTDCLLRALDSGWQSVVIVSHNFELMDPSCMRPEWVNIKRFSHLCNFLDKHRNDFQAKGFDQVTQLELPSTQQEMVSVDFTNTVTRLIEQGVKRVWN